MRLDRTCTLALARLDLGDVLRSRWLVFCLALYGVLAALWLHGLRRATAAVTVLPDPHDGADRRHCPGKPASLTALQRAD